MDLLGFYSRLLQLFAKQRDVTIFLWGGIQLFCGDISKRGVDPPYQNVKGNGQFVLGSQVAKEPDEISPDSVKNASTDGIERSNRCKKEHFYTRHQLEIHAKLHNVHQRLLDDSPDQEASRKRGCFGSSLLHARPRRYAKACPDKSSEACKIFAGKGHFQNQVLDIKIVLLSQFVYRRVSCSQRKARNLFKEDLLYSTGKKTDQAEEIDELQDQDQIIREIEDLQTEKSKLILDINKCEQFINLKSSSAYFRFHYLLTKLQFIRKCTQLGSASMLTADYFSMVLDKRKEMIESVKFEMENVQKTMDQIQSLRQQFDNEITSFVSAMDQSEEGCRSIVRDAEQAEQAAFLGQLPSQQRLDMLDDKLAQIIRSFKEKVSRSVPKKSKEKEKVEVELSYDPAVATDDVVKASAENLNKFKENVGATMQRCFQHIEGRLLRMQASRRALMEDNAVPNSERIVESVKEIHVNLASREDSLSRMVTLENSLRRSAEQAFEDRTRSLLSAVAQSEQASISHLKVSVGFRLASFALFSLEYTCQAHYHNLYAKSPSRVRRRSTLLL